MDIVLQFNRSNSINQKLSQRKPFSTRAVPPGKPTMQSLIKPSLAEARASNEVNHRSTFFQILESFYRLWFSLAVHVSRGNWIRKARSLSAWSFSWRARFSFPCNLSSFFTGTRMPLMRLEKGGSTMTSDLSLDYSLFELRWTWMHAGCRIEVEYNWEWLQWDAIMKFGIKIIDLHFGLVENVIYYIQITKWIHYIQRELKFNCSIVLQEVK